MKAIKISLVTINHLPFQMLTLSNYCICQALHYKKYSSASDVWSYGAGMYEIMESRTQTF